MASETLRDKIASTLITVLLTVLGAASYQSAKYLFVDYRASVKNSQHSIDVMEEAHHKFITESETFLKITKTIEPRFVERHNLLNKSLDKVSQNRIKDVEVRQTLLQAYEDLGAMSYAPGAQPLIQSERATLVDEIKSQIDGVEIVEKWQYKSPLTGAQRSEALAELERNQRLRFKASSAHASVDENFTAALENMKAEHKTALDRYTKEQAERSRWYYVYLILGLFCLTSYWYLVSYVTRSKPLTPEKALEKKAAECN